MVTEGSSPRDVRGGAFASPKLHPARPLGSRLGSLFQRAASANSLQGDYEGKKLSYSDRFSGYAIFVSNDNADRAASLAFGHSLGQELQKRGLRYTPHHTLPLMGRYR
jgi:hypothetical protein